MVMGKIISIYLPPEIWEKLKLKADKEGKSVSKVIQEALEVFLKREEKIQAARKFLEWVMKKGGNKEDFRRSCN
jgi:predicted DNA-binding protein